MKFCGVVSVSQGPSLALLRISSAARYYHHHTPRSERTAKLQQQISPPLHPFPATDHICFTLTSIQMPRRKCPSSKTKSKQSPPLHSSLHTNQLTLVHQLRPLPTSHFIPDTYQRRRRRQTHHCKLQYPKRCCIPRCWLGTESLGLETYILPSNSHGHNKRVLPSTKVSRASQSEFW